ncbi:MAG: S-layer homology domain-containing protein, partial [Selenomonadales bacterium]|nr:S-layer homology domain-containing protein [Selenomonadales bacterium]
AAAIGAFYRPNERVMFSIGGTVGNGEDMVNAGVSFALGKGGKVNASRVAAVHEINELRQQVAYLSAVVAQMAEQTGYQFTDMKPFPDTPENHWAYEYIAKLAAEGIVEGYPNGNFDGDRTMTRYEFAAMLFHALEKGITLDTKIIDEFEPELGRLSVERIKGEQNQKEKIERVRLNNTAPDRDAYGGKINVGKNWP